MSLDGEDVTMRGRGDKKLRKLRLIISVKINNNGDENLFGLLSPVNVISTCVSYPIPKPSLYKDSSGTI